MSKRRKSVCILVFGCFVLSCAILAIFGEFSMVACMIGVLLGMTMAWILAWSPINYQYLWVMRDADKKIFTDKVYYGSRKDAQNAALFVAKHGSGDYVELDIIEV